LALKILTLKKMSMLRFKRPPLPFGKGSVKSEI
jgi:hypothetical protein